MAKLGLLPAKRQRETILRSRDRLVRRGLLKYQDKNLYLTTKGERVLRILRLRDSALQKPKRWDKKWRVLIFDIPEKRKKLREQIRRTLASIGFMRLQDSVWLYPYDCEDFITLLKADLKTGNAILYMVVEKIENDGKIKEFFGLS